ncbi:glutamine--tRNA ligase/YqeY domain fusion protein [Pseudobacteriovorax antillogorgiicola]|uniref:Glutamine--tRNA ligase n=1 Tax=Pseudobacteriovorax antillogorgiicola TaxID=1513793 RepID=A0A1Y6BWJ7_9BACT|nr:glutamine--tRNA ligase/YqeY domain fusion protein [Pseudobacteriovorax antillogorgiicola]TCS50239.1 glutaminyl-tRNA synthetase [Pseudobacteriovorax antillogorgiicola]SMF32788.1 glutaminyl-tRNA synthetase [Pseudobacteriovorax antillogorgiicola]
MTDDKKPAVNFIRNIINEDLKNGKNGGRVVTRFPPEPNGYLHIGHAKSICFNFSLAQEYPGGKCYLRFDDTNPEKESVEFMESIKRDVAWLGFDWEDRLTHASDYFDRLYELAEGLIQRDKAYVCSLNAEQAREYRGTLKEPGKDSPDRNRPVEESLDLFRRMKAGEFADGTYTLRAKIDMSSGNINMRDPVLYRIRKVHHHRTGDKWNIYPMYDYTHPLSDAFEAVTHSICTLEFQDHRPLYDWIIEQCETEFVPHQYEFSRLNVNYTITSKRKLKYLVDQGLVSGWDDPRMPTISGMRRRGLTPASLRKFSERTGISKKETIIDVGILEEEVRNDLNETAKRAFAVLDPIKVTISNYPEGKEEVIEIPNHPQKPDWGTREILFEKTLYIDRSDFLEDAPPKFFRLSPGKEVRLRYGYVIRCDEVIKDDAGVVRELVCTYDPDTLGGKKPADGRKVKGIIHWLSESGSKPALVRIYDRLFNVENPGVVESVEDALNPESLLTMVDSRIENSLTQVAPGDTFQFERLGYFCADQIEFSAEKPVFNRTVTLKDTWQSKN